MSKATKQALIEYVNDALQGHLEQRAEEIAQEIETGSGNQYKVTLDKSEPGVISISPSDDELARQIEFGQGNTAWRKQLTRLK